MRSRRPELFSDSKKIVKPQITREVFEYYLQTLTNRKQESEFEHFCRALAEKEICPNLLPQTGPTGGGDSKVDAETYPVADAISLRWYEGVGREAATERWAFAFSAKKKWSPKIDSDVSGIAATGRGYRLIYFITNQFVPDRKRAEKEDKLRKTYDVQVRILDRSWIIKVIFEKQRFQLAVETLGLAGCYDERQQKIVGPNDVDRAARLQELDAQIADPSRYCGIPYQLAEDCLRAALLARGLERPVDEVDGRFDRALRVAESGSSRQQRLRIAYARAWTKFWWHDDVSALNRLYDVVEGLAAQSDQVSDIELVLNLWHLVHTSAMRGLIEASEANIVERTGRLRSEFARLSALKDRPTTALQAKSNILLMDITEAFRDNDLERLNSALVALRHVLQKSERMVNFPGNRLAQTVQELGVVLVDNEKYDELFELVVELLNRRSSEASAGETLLGRGIQKLNGGKTYDAIRLFGRAQQKLALHEHRAEHITAVAGCAQAYEAAGLLWAGRANMLLAASQALVPFWEEGRVLPQALVCLKRLAWFEIQLGRISYALEYLRVAAVIAAALNLSDERRRMFLEEREAQDRFIGILLLRTDLAQLQSLVHAPQLLEELELPYSRLCLLYALGYESELRHEGSIPSSETDESVRNFFWTCRNGDAGGDLPQTPELLARGDIKLRTIVLGCEVTVVTASDIMSLRIGESIVGAIEAFLSTSIDGRVIPYRSSFSIRVEPSDSSERKIRSRLVDADGEAMVFVTHAMKASELAVEDEDPAWLVEVLVTALLQMAIVPDGEAYIDRLAREEAAFGRILSCQTLTTCMKNVLGESPKLFLAEWHPEDVDTFFPLRRSVPWDAELKPKAAAEAATKRQFNPGSGPPPETLSDTNRLKHNDHRVVSLIDVPRWNRANWQATAYVYSTDLSYAPVLALGFKDASAGKEIFARFQKEIGKIDKLERLRVAIITGIDKSHPAHYAVVIGSSLTDQGNRRDLRLFMLSRINRMRPSSSTNLDAFVKSFQASKRYLLAPAQFTTASVAPEIFFKYGIEKGEVVIRPAWELGENDPDISALDLDDEPVVPPEVRDPPVRRALAQLRKFRLERVTLAGS
jgi:hypothetical protein